MKKIHYTDVAPQGFKNPAEAVSRRVLIGKADGANNFCMRMIELALGGLVPPHSHPWEHEQFFHSGRGQVLDGATWIDVGPGDVAFIPAGARHGTRNTDEEPPVRICLVPPFTPEL